MPVVHAANLRTTSYGNLPDAYVEIRLGQLSMRTDTVKRSAGPSWNHVFHLWVLCGSVIAYLTLIFPRRLSNDPSTVLLQRVMHRTLSPFLPDLCLGYSEDSIKSLLDKCSKQHGIMFI